MTVTKEKEKISQGIHVHLYITLVMAKWQDKLIKMLPVTQQTMNWHSNHI